MPRFDIILVVKVNAITLRIMVNFQKSISLNLPPLPDADTRDEQVKPMYQAYDLAVSRSDGPSRELSVRLHAINKYIDYLDGQPLREAVELKERAMLKLASAAEITRLDVITKEIADSLFPNDQKLAEIKFKTIIDQLPSTEEIDLLNAHQRFPDDQQLRELEIRRLNKTISPEELAQMGRRLSAMN